MKTLLTVLVCVMLLGILETFTFAQDTDGDSIPDSQDNCPNDYNPAQEDTYPPAGNGCGDVCDCEGNFDGDMDVDADDVTTFLRDFGRGTYFEPCGNPLYGPCNGDVSCDGDVDAYDVTKFLEDFGRGQYHNPCPSCLEGVWCGFNIIENGEAYVEIVKPIDATAGTPEDTAANELNTYLQDVTGVSVGVVSEGFETIDKIPIYIGDCQASQHLNDELAALINNGYVIEIKTDVLHLRGKNDLATFFAVYGFLQDYIGVHWFLPEVFEEDDGFPPNMGTHIPHKETIRVPPILDIQDPSFKYRRIGTPTVNSVEADWSIRNRVNYTHESDLGFQMNRMAHSFHDFVGPEEYADDDQAGCFYPEYFARKDGIPWGDVPNASERIMHPDVKQNIKLNLTNQCVKDIIIHEAINCTTGDDYYEPCSLADCNDDMEKVCTANVDIMNLFPSDGFFFDESIDDYAGIDGANNMCYTVGMANDEAKRLGSGFGPVVSGSEFGRVLSKRYTMFYHDVTEAILETSDATLMTAAYSAYQHAPFEVYDQSFRSAYTFDDRVILLLAHSWEHNHPIGASKPTPPNEYFAESIAGWKEIYSKLGVYEYYRKVAMCELPFPIIHSIKEDIPYYYNNGFSFFFTQFDAMDIGTYGLNYYVASQLLWDVNADVEDIRDEFYSRFYGPAGNKMKSYFERLEDAAIESDVALSPRFYREYLKLFTDTVITECKGFLQAAKNAVTGNELYLKRIELSEISLNYTELVINYLHEIESVIDADNQLVSRNMGDPETATIKAMAENIQNFISQQETEQTKTIKDSTYVQNLLHQLDEQNAIKNFYGPYTKKHWLERNHINAERGYGSNTYFDIWIYAHDIDYFNTEGLGPEHQISILTEPCGEPVVLEEIARNATEAGNGTFKGFLISHFSLDQLVDTNDSITLKILNYPDPPSTPEVPICGPYGSVFYAIAIMPHDENTTQAQVTDAFENNLYYVRENALGFVEFKQRNNNACNPVCPTPPYPPCDLDAPVDDHTELITFTIDLYTH